MFEAIVAWRTLKKPEIETVLVQDDATMEELWDSVEIDVFSYAEALGSNIQNALPRLKQLQKLNIIYSDNKLDIVDIILIKFMLLHNEICEMRWNVFDDQRSICFGFAGKR